MTPLSVHQLPQLRREEAQLLGALAIGAATVGAIYLLVRRPGLPEVEITILEEYRRYSRGGALHWLLPSSVTAVRVTGHGGAVASLPRALCSLAAMRELSLSGNALAELPPALGRLTALVSLDVSGNKLSSLPPELGALTALTSLNAMNNELGAVPDALGALRALRRLGLKGNRLRALPASVGQLTALRELFLTGNELEALPEEIGGCTSLVKLQASHNRLAALPAALAALPRLEFLRVACCNITVVPSGFANAEALAWLSLGSNPGCARSSPRRLNLPVVRIEELVVGRKLGEGASGDVFEATWRGRRTAVKLFRSEASPDGHSRDEVAVASAVADAHLVRVVALLEAPLGGLLMEFVPGVILADKPNSESLLRCRWPSASAFELAFVLRCAAGVAAGLEHMHYRGAAHGDVYAHNVMADDQGNAVLCDHGAAFLYARDDPLAAAYEGYDVRAFGLFLLDLARRVDIGFEGMQAALDAQKQLLMLVQQCTTGPPARRPRFGAIRRRLESLQKAAGRGGAALTPRSDSRVGGGGGAAGGAGYATAR